MTQTTVSTYNLQTKTGRHIRKATRVTFADGTVVNFMEKMSKGEAIKQAEARRNRTVQMPGIGSVEEGIKAGFASLHYTR